MKNALEILHSQTDVQGDKVLALLSSSSERALQGIAYFKTAYGYVSDDQVNLHAVDDLVGDFFNHFCIDVHFVYHHEVLATKIVKLILNVLLVLKPLIVINGSGSSITVDINTNEKFTPTIVITAKANKSYIDKDLVPILRGSNSKIYPTLNNVHQFFTYFVSRDASYEISTIYAKGEIKMELLWLRAYA
jgi:hypothetical protein